MFLPESDRAYLEEKKYKFREIIDGAHKGLIIENWQLPTGKYNVSVADLLIIIPNNYPDVNLDMFYFNPSILLVPYNRLPRATNVVFNFEGKQWQRWSRHYPPAEWRPGIDGIHTYLKKVIEAVRIAT